MAVPCHGMQLLVVTLISMPHIWTLESMKHWNVQLLEWWWKRSFFSQTWNISFCCWPFSELSLWEEKLPLFAFSSLFSRAGCSSLFVKNRNHRHLPGILSQKSCFSKALQNDWLHKRISKFYWLISVGKNHVNNKS